MLLLILFISFLLTYFSVGVSFIYSKSKKELLLISVIIFSVAVVLITELLSSLSKLNFTGTLVSWTVFSGINLVYLYIAKFKLPSLSDIIIYLKRSLNQFNTIERVLMGCVCCILALVFVQGIIYPPNNYDSMTYHLSRILSWISHASVLNYPTDITRQLYQPPFAEYLVMHINLLTGADYLANSAQFFFLMFTVVTTMLFIEMLGLGGEYKIAGILLICTIPEVLLEASTTQNDIIVSFFVLSALYFTVKIIQKCEVVYFIFLGFSVALAVLTKGTAYIYLAPIVLFAIIGTVVNFSRTFKFNYLWFSLLSIALFVLMNAGYYSRNYHLSGNFLGVDQQESKEYSNQKMNAGYFISNCIKNAGLHLCFMYTNSISDVSEKAIYKIHEWMKVDINDSAVNYRHNIFSTKSNITNEDCAPNMVHFIIILAAFIILAIRKGQNNSKYVNLIGVIIVIQVILFCSYLKWQPWHSRLHIPFFLFSVPLVCYVISTSLSFKKFFYILSPLMLIYALLIVFHNYVRPYNGSIKLSRYDKYFMNKPEARDEYGVISTTIKKLNYKNIGLKLNVDDWVYPLFRDFYHSPINPVYVQPDNFSNKISTGPVNVDCIVTTLVNKPYIDFNGRRYYNQFIKNKILYFYK